MLCWAVSATFSRMLWVSTRCQWFQLTWIDDLITQFEMDSWRCPSLHYFLSVMRKALLLQNVGCHFSHYFFWPLDGNTSLGTSHNPQNNQIKKIYFVLILSLFLFWWNRILLILLLILPPRLLLFLLLLLQLLLKLLLFILLLLLLPVVLLLILLLLLLLLHLLPPPLILLLLLIIINF